jgi:predicted DNA-binding ribbon-helix-helix protein
MAKFVDQANNTDIAKLRQVQLHGRRFAISIEPIFWQCLEDAAIDLGIRLNQLVGILSEADTGPKNLAARLRIFSVRRMRRLLNEARLTPRNLNLVELVDAIPTPCLAVTEKRRISHVNEALLKLMGDDVVDVVGDPSDKFFRLRYPDPLPIAWEKLGQPNANSQSGSVAYMMPGRVMARRMVTVPLKGARRGRYYCLIVLH